MVKRVMIELDWGSGGGNQYSWDNQNIQIESSYDSDQLMKFHLLKEGTGRATFNLGKVLPVSRLLTSYVDMLLTAPDLDRVRLDLPILNTILQKLTSVEESAFEQIKKEIASDSVELRRHPKYTALMLQEVQNNYGYIGQEGNEVADTSQLVGFKSVREKLQEQRVQAVIPTAGALKGPWP